MSIRERNRAQRKARQMVSKQRSVEIEDEEPKRKKSKVETVVVESSDNVPDLTGSWGNVSNCQYAYLRFQKSIKNALLYDKYISGCTLAISIHL